MILYTPFWDTIHKKGITTYTLIKNYKVSSSTLSRLKRNMPISTVTINDLCSILNCRVEDILQYRADAQK